LPHSLKYDIIVVSWTKEEGMATVRDIAIIILAIESIVIGALLIFLVIQVQNLIRLLKEESKPILDSANETINTVRGTSTFVSGKMVSPVIGVLSYFAAARRLAQLLTGGLPKRKG
jgi:amino acid permease